jgi:hypothetical protein
MKLASKGVLFFCVALGCFPAIDAFAQQRAIKPQELLVALPSGVMTSVDIKYFETCKFTPCFKAGMTNSEANDAIDAAWDKFVQCWKNRGRPTAGPGAR